MQRYKFEETTTGNIRLLNHENDVFNFMGDDMTPVSVCEGDYITIVDYSGSMCTHVLITKMKYNAENNNVDIEVEDKFTGTLPDGLIFLGREVG